MMKKIILIFILLTPVVCSAQTRADNLKKYWYYRLRLKNDFLKVGPNPGESIPAETRHSSGQYFEKIRWGDATMYLGWYIGVLATEYRLLKYNNENEAHFNQDLTDVKNVYGVTSDYSTETPADPETAEMSHDQIYPLLMGFVLVKRFVDNGVTYNGVALRQKAIDMAGNIIEYLEAGNWVIKNAVTGENVDRGWNGAVLRSYGLAEAGKKITGEGYQNALSHWNYYIWQLAQTFVNTISYNNYHKAILAAIGDSWRVKPDGTIPKFVCLLCPNSTYQGLANSTAWADWDPFYLTLWALLNNKNWTLPSPQSHLDSAPCEGPYVYVDDKAGDSWASRNRYMGAPDVQIDGHGSGNEGDHNGLDYMLMHNLSFLKDLNSSVNLDLPRYANLIDYIEKLDYPVPWYSAYHPLGSKNVPGNIDAFRSITSNKLIDAVIGGSDDYIGDVTYRAGVEISLEPPFEVKEGAEFYAYVDPFECSTSGYYKSLADTTQNDSTIAGNDPRDAMNSLYGMHDPLPLKNKVLPLTYNEEEDIYPEYETMDTSTAPTLQDGFDIYPNPTPGEKFYAAISDSGFTGDQVLVVILDILGIEHYSKVFVLEDDEHLLAIDPAGKLTTGVYMVIATSNNGIYRRKIVVR
ncbi:MAG: T9SS type A sorting domain-containing protein [Bacteroidota bacterium]